MTSAAQSMSFFMLICAVPLAGLTVYTYRHWRKPGARGLFLCLVGMTGWSVALATVTWPTQPYPVHFNTTVRHTFQILVIFGWPLFAWEYIRREQVTIRTTHAAALLVIPVLTIFLTATNPAHHLVIAAETPANPMGISEFVLGPWYLVHIGFAVAMVMLPVGVLLKEFRTAHGAHRRQLLLLLTGWAIGFPGALLTHLFRTIDAIPLYVDLTPVAFLVTAALWALALFRYQLFTMVPVSRRMVVETIPDPVIAVDQNGRVVDINPAGRELFDIPEDVAGIPLGDHFADHPEILEFYREGAVDAEFELWRNGTQRRFSVTCERIREGGSDAVIVLRDITPLKEREEKLREREQELTMLQQVFSRVFRHNIRNELTVAQGHLESINFQTEEESVAESATVALDSTNRLLGHAEKAREIERVIGRNPELTTQSVTTLVEKAIAIYECDSAAATIEVDVGDHSVRAIEGFETAIENALENAIEHNPPPVTVTITAEAVEDGVVIEVADDGRGIPQNEIGALMDEEEGPLHHGSGVGLWLLKWHVQKSTGALEITSGAGGSVVRMTLPRAG